MTTISSSRVRGVGHRGSRCGAGAMEVCQCLGKVLVVAGTEDDGGKDVWRRQ